jgi:hypothetical protein
LVVRDTASNKPDFLRIGAAADLLGVSRLRLREAVACGLIPARRDNEGNLRVDLSNANADRLSRDMARMTGRIEGPALVDLLFDEIEELQDNAPTDSAQVHALTDLVTRQAAVIERSEGLLSDMAHREGRMLDLLQRAMALHEVSRTGSDGQAQALGATVDQAFTLLGRAVREAEQTRAAASQATDLLGRAMDAGERLEGELAARDGVISQQDHALERAVDISEKAVALASKDPRPRSRGFWAWLTGQ